MAVAARTTSPGRVMLEAAAAEAAAAAALAEAEAEASAVLGR
jgi:hypothetical protein